VGSAQSRWVLKFGPIVPRKLGANGSLLTRRWRKPDSNPRSPDRGQHFSRREASSNPYPLTTRSEIVHHAKSG
jgi:hypothetical protein